MKFSIVIPTLNEEKYVSGILESLANQTHKDFEVIVVDGPSKDKTKEVVLSFVPKFTKILKGKSKFRYVKSPKKGVSFQRNYGASKAKNDYVLFFDADTLIEPVFLHKVSVFLKNNPNIDIFTCWNIPISKRIRDKMLFWAFNQLYLEGSKRLNPGAVGTFMGVKKQSFQDVGGFSTQVVLAEDFELVARMHKSKYKYALLKDPVIYFSVRRLNAVGRVPYMITSFKAGIYYYVVGPIKDFELFNYDMDGNIR